MTDTPPDVVEPPRTFPAEPTPGPTGEAPALSDVVDSLDDATKLLDAAAEVLVERRYTVAAERRDDYTEVEDQVASAWARATLALTTLRPIAASETSS